MTHLVIGTAGHIDHGKTALVRALTGIDTDRLKEEKARGITIELGFAHLDLPDFPPIGIVDVPGHEKFVHHMVAGATGMNMVLLVIAADEGIMPQTREHLDICRLLGVSRGLVALTKSDLVEKDWLELVQDEVREFIAGTFLENAPLVPVSSQTGEGLEELREAIREQLRKSALPARSGSARLPIDRVFTMKGFGTVVTGTLLSGTLKVGEAVELLPSGSQYRIRGLQVHGRSVTSAGAGQRTAVNLQGAEKSSLNRGDTLALPGMIEPSYLMDAKLQLLPGNGRPLRNRRRVRLHLGTSEILARVVILGRDLLEPGEEGLVQFRLEKPGVALPRDRFVIRSYSPMVTIGGGELIDTHPVKHKTSSQKALHSVELLASGDPLESSKLLLEEAGPAGLTPRDLSKRLNLDESDAAAGLDRLATQKEAFIVSGRPTLYLYSGSVRAVEKSLLDILSSFHRQEPLRPGLSKEELRSRLRATANAFAFILKRLQKSGSIVVERDLIRLSSHAVRLRSDQEEVKGKVEAYFLRVGLQPPVRAVVLKELGLEGGALDESIKLLQSEGRLKKISEDLTIHGERLGPLEGKVASFLKSKGRITMQDFKEISGLSRKYTIPLMEYFDRTGLTIRVGDHRVLRD